jgi:hypothetical protein
LARDRENNKMQKMRAAQRAAAGLAVLIAGCGDGLGGSSTPAPSPSRAAAALLTLATPAVIQEIDYLDELAVTVSGTWSGGAISSNGVFVQLRDGSGTFAAVPIQRLSDMGRFMFTVLTPRTLAVGTHVGKFEIRACADSACASPYAGARASLAYSVKVNPVIDWSRPGRLAPLPE